MTGLGRYLVGLLLAGVSLGPIVLAAVRLRTRMLPGARGALARVVEVVVGAGLLVVALEAVGVVGAFDRVGAVLACVVVGIAGTLAGSAGAGAPPRPANERPMSPGARVPRLLAVAAVAVLSASWVGWTLYAYRHGMETVDTLWYHLPTAARFVQTGSILHLQYFDAEPVTVFYPANAELFHAFGLLLFGSDLVSPLINLGWASLALLAAWAIGARSRRGPHSLILATLVLVTPALVDTQPGGAYNDTACIALILCSAAVLLGSDATPGPGAAAVAAVAAGLAIGAKFTMIVPAVALGMGAVAVAESGRRGRQAGIWLAGLLGLGGYWYLRNAVLVGNPVPSLALSLGPLSLPAPTVSTPSFTVFQYLTDGHVWRAFYVPGLRRALGPAWWAIILLGCAGAVAAVIRADRVLRMVGVVTLVSLVAFLLTPQFLGLPGAPIYFVFNVRYIAGPLALGLVLAPVAPAFAAPRRVTALLVVAGCCLVATELDPGVWPTGIGLTPFATPLRGGSALAGWAFALGVLVLGSIVVLVGGRRRIGLRKQSRLRAPLIAAVGVLVLAFAGGAMAVDYGHHRYQDSPPLPRIYRWARTVSHTRIGIVGFTAQYPLYGTTDSNYVQYIGAGAAHRGFASITTCPAWRRAVNQAHYRWLVIAPAGFPFGAGVGPEVGWTGSTGAAHVVLSERAGSGPNDHVVLLRVTGALDPATCPRAASAS